MLRNKTTPAKIEKNEEIPSQTIHVSTFTIEVSWRDIANKNIAKAHPVRKNKNPKNNFSLYMF